MFISGSLFVTHLIVSNGLYIALVFNIYVLLKISASMMMDYVGCFIDSGDRDLPVHQWYDDDMTIEKCAAHCQGYVYAGTQVCGMLVPRYDVYAGTQV